MEFYQRGRGPKDGAKGWEGDSRDRKRIKMCSVPVPTPLNEHNH